MKKRYLRPSIQWVLVTIFIFQFMLLGVNDFELTLTNVIILVLNLVTMIINGYILVKYGKIFEDE